MGKTKEEESRVGQEKSSDKDTDLTAMKGKKGGRRVGQ